MKSLLFLFLLFLFCSFCPSVEKAVINSRNGFYIHVEDFTDRSYHQYILESSDSVNIIFRSYFDSELDLGELDRPITIFNGKCDFYVSRVTVFEKADGQIGFRHLKYPKVYNKESKSVKRSKLKPVNF